MSKIANDIEENSLNIKLTYAQMLIQHLVRVKPESADTAKKLMLRLRNVQGTSVPIAKYTVDNVVESMHRMLESLEESSTMPSTSAAAAAAAVDDDMLMLPPPVTPFSPSVAGTADSESVESFSMDVNNNDFDENGNINRDMNEIKILTLSLLESNSLQSLTRHSLFEFERMIGDDSLIYEDYFKNGIELDAIDCDLNDNLQRFKTIFERYGPVRCVVTDVEYYAERVRRDPDLVASLPPTVRAAVVTILDLVERNQAYTLDININPKEFNEIKDVFVKALLNRYSEHRPINFNVAATVASPAAGAASSTAASEREVNIVSSSTDEEDVQMTQTMRRKRKMRSPLWKNAAANKSKKIDQPSRIGGRGGSGAAAGNLSDEAFIDNVRQMHQSNAIVPKLIAQIVNVVPSDVASSLLTCPTNGLSDVKVSAQNYNTTISAINKMNLTAINENVYFYKLLEPLAYYGSSEELVTKVLWFIARTANYFINSARNFNYLRDSLRTLTDDVDRVALFMIRYNFLWFYRQFLDQLLSAPTTPYQNQKVINVLHVYASVVQKEYSKIRYDFNQSRVYVGPVDNVIKLMVVSTSDILV
ncbi:VP80 [Spodoptera cosmioides nucleopolyhedrovirus]|uniref:VP80 n=1 Tax=Spodoptera cosmioides nucleopolyhedrovirus TaxID=2605774 RepID=A0A6B7KTB3_9ABAC|nr:VP80 [Spodoptera cosmioides nucleopolyhedrovirus]